MPSGLVSPRARPATLRDLGERSTFVAGQRIGRGSRRRRRLRRVVRVLPVAALVVLLAAGAALGTRWLLTTPRLAAASVEVRGASRLPDAQMLAAAPMAPGGSILGRHTHDVRRRATATAAVRRAHGV